MYKVSNITKDLVTHVTSKDAYCNNSNKRPGRLLNYRFLHWPLFEMGGYSFSHKIWGGIEKTVQERIVFVAVAFSLWFPISTDIDAVFHISIQKSVFLLQ